MDFEFEDVFTVSEEDLNKMVLLCLNDGYTPFKAIYEVLQANTTLRFYKIKMVENQIISTIEWRIRKAKGQVKPIIQ